jgi:hypothetical protein
MIPAFNIGALPAAEEAELEKLLQIIHTHYDPFQDWEDWRLWMLAIRGKTLDLARVSPNYAPVITRMLANSVMGLAMHDLQKKHDTEGIELKMYAKTHPLLSAEEVPKEGFAYVENWGFIHWQRQQRLIALIQLYEYLNHPNSDWLPPETKQINFPSAWLAYINSFDTGFRLSLWGATAHWGNTSPAHINPNLQAARPALSAKLFVRDICRPPLCQDDFSDLLVRLGVIDSEGNCMTNHLKGPARSKRGAFTAAYRVLHRAGLLEPVSDSQLGEVLSNTYRAELGPDVLSYELTAKGMAPALAKATASFIRAVDTCKEWLTEWKARLNMPDNA